jgi:hypothetical protein
MMRRHPTIALARYLAIAPILAQRWDYKELKGAPAGAAQMVEDAFEDGRLQLLQKTLLGIMDFGFMSFEKLFDFMDDFLIIKQFKPLIHDLTLPLINGATGELAGVRQTWINLPIEKLFYVTEETEGTMWYGRSRLENVELAYDGWVECNAAAARYDQKAAGTMLVVKVPDGNTVVNGETLTNMEAAHKFIKAIQSNGGIAVPRQLATLLAKAGSNLPPDIGEYLDWNFELLQDTPKQTGFIERQSYLDKQILRGMLVLERTAVEGQYGTRSEASVHMDAALTICDIHHHLVLKQLNKQCVDQILELNYGSEARGTVCIEAETLDDEQNQFFRDIYMKAMDNPAALQDFKKMDIDELSEELGVPLSDKVNEKQEIVSADTTNPDTIKQEGNKND